MRLTTVHPALVHCVLGTFPLMLLAYGIGATRRSARWSFVGDVTASVTAALSLVVVGFGFVSNAYLDWPGGLGLFRWLHIGLGLTTSLALLLLSGVRLARRKQKPVAGAPAFWGVVGVTAVAFCTGWVGGEVLVFHGGMAVEAAADGALAPPVERAHTPHGLKDAMGQLRAQWASANARLSGALVNRPDAADFEAITSAARRAEQLAIWVQEHGEEHEHGEEREHGEEHAHSAAHAQSAGRAHAAESAETKPDAENLRHMAGELRERARGLEHAAQRKDLKDVATAFGRLSETCGGCHEAHRWNEPEETAALDLR